MIPEVQPEPEIVVTAHIYITETLGELGHPTVRPVVTEIVSMRSRQVTTPSLMARAGGSVRPCAPTGARKQHLVFHFRPDRKQLPKVHLISSLMIHPITSLRTMDVMVTTGAIRRAKLQSNHHHERTNRHQHTKIHTFQNIPAKEGLLSGD